jgi:hypothetical protein
MIQETSCQRILKMLRLLTDYSKLRKKLSKIASTLRTVHLRASLMCRFDITYSRSGSNRFRGRPGCGNKFLAHLMRVSSPFMRVLFRMAPPLIDRLFLVTCFDSITEVAWSKHKTQLTRKQCPGWKMAGVVFYAWHHIIRVSARKIRRQTKGKNLIIDKLISGAKPLCEL